MAVPFPITIDNVPVFYDMPKESLPIQPYAEQVQNTVSQKLFSLPDMQQGQIQEKINLSPQKQGLAAIHYCPYCGYVHPEEACPLVNPAKQPDFLDGQFMF